MKGGNKKKNYKRKWEKKIIQLKNKKKTEVPNRENIN